MQIRELKEYALFHAQRFGLTGVTETISVSLKGNKFTLIFGSISYDGYQAIMEFKATTSPLVGDFSLDSFVVTNGDFSVSLDLTNSREYFFDKMVELTVSVKEAVDLLMAEREKLGSPKETIVYNDLTRDTKSSEILLFASDKFESSFGLEDLTLTFKDSKDLENKLKYLEKTHLLLHGDLFNDEDFLFQLVDLENSLVRNFKSMSEIIEAVKYGFVFDLFLRKIMISGCGATVEVTSLEEYLKLKDSFSVFPPKSLTVRPSISTNPLD